MAINSKSTKAQILEAYKKLQKEKAQIQKQMESGGGGGTPTTTPAPTKTQSSRNAPITKNSPKNMQNIEQIITSLENLQVSFGSAVSQLSEQLITEATSLHKLQTNIDEEVTDLEQLHGIATIEDNTLSELLTDYQESEKNFSGEYTQREETLEQELEDLTKQWQKEQQNHQREVKLRNDSHQKTKQREEEEYQYDLKLKREIELDEYEQRINELYQELKETRETEEKGWADKEKEISEKEKEYAEAKEKVAEFDEKLKSEVKKAKDAGKGIGTYQAKVKADLRNKVIEGETQNYQLRIQALEATINNNQTRINSLSQQLDSALKQVQDLAVKAIGDSKAGGEVSNTVIFGYSNKGHDGFLGNSVIGEWCNLGADTNNSNLKNNYANVKMWDYAARRFSDTGLQFCGLVMGDHSKCGINTMFNTGTSVGVSANIFGEGFPRTIIPSFAWGGSSGFSTYQTRKAFETAELVVQRRGKSLTEADKQVLSHIFEMTSEYRVWEKK